MGKYILKKYDYNPHSLVPWSLIIENVNEAIEIGIDDILKAEEIPSDDPLKFKQVKPSNNNYYSIDYRTKFWEQ